MEKWDYMFFYLRKNILTTMITDMFTSPNIGMLYVKFNYHSRRELSILRMKQVKVRP